MTDLADINASLQQLTAAVEGTNAQLVTLAAIFGRMEARPHLKDALIVDLLSEFTVSLNDLVLAETRQANELEALREGRAPLHRSAPVRPWHDLILDGPAGGGAE